MVLLLAAVAQARAATVKGTVILNELGGEAYPEPPRAVERASPSPPAAASLAPPAAQRLKPLIDRKRYA